MKTLKVSEEVWKALRHRATEESKSLGVVTEEMLRMGLSVDEVADEQSNQVHVEVDPMTPYHVTPRTKKVLTGIQDPLDGEPLCGRCGHRQASHTAFGCDGACRCKGFQEG